MNSSTRKINYFVLIRYACTKLKIFYAILHLVLLRISHQNHELLRWNLLVHARIDMSCKLQLRRFLPSFLCCYLFCKWKPLSHCFEETVGFDVKASLASCLVSRLIRWHNKRIMRKGYSLPRGFSWIENVKVNLACRRKNHWSGPQP